MQIFDCMGEFGTLNACVVQGSTVYIFRVDKNANLDLMPSEKVYFKYNNTKNFK